MDCHHSMQLLGGSSSSANGSSHDASPTIAVRGSITLSSGRYLPSLGANQSLNLQLSYGESSSSCSQQQQQQIYTSLSSATPTLSSLLNTPSLLSNGSHQQQQQQASMNNLLKSSNTSSNNSPQCSRTPSHNPPLPSLKNRNIVAANPLLAGNY